MRNFEDYHNLCVSSDTLLLAYVFGNLTNMCSEIYELGSAKLLSAPGLAWWEIKKKTKIKLDFLTDINMLLMVEKGIGEGIGHSIYWHLKANIQ